MQSADKNRRVVKNNINIIALILLMCLFIVMLMESCKNAATYIAGTKEPQTINQK